MKIGRLYKKTNNKIEKNKIFFLENLFFFRFGKKGNTIKKLNKIENWWINKEKVVAKKWKKCFFFDTKNIDDINNEIQAACLTGPIPTTIIK